MAPPAPSPLILGYVPGATPGKWARTWARRHPDLPLQLRAVAAADAGGGVRDGAVHLAVLRLPADTTGLATITLYDESSVAVIPTDHWLAAADPLTAADLEGEPMLLPDDDVVHWADAPGVPVAHRPQTTRAAIELVAAGMGVLVVPQSLARLHHRRDLTYRPIPDAPVCRVALAFPDGPPSAPVEEFIGIVRGRTAASSRGREQPAPKRTAREKTLAKQAARAAAGKVARRPGPTDRGRR